MWEKSYTQALIKAAQGKDVSFIEKVLVQLKAQMDARGHGRLYPRVLERFEAYLSESSKKGKGTVLVARADDLKLFQNEIEKRAQEMGVSASDLSQEVNEKLVGGYRIETVDAVYDNSYRSKLISLYRKLITA